MGRGRAPPHGATVLKIIAKSHRTGEERIVIRETDRSCGKIILGLLGEPVDHTYRLVRENYKLKGETK